MMWRAWRMSWCVVFQEAAHRKWVASTYADTAAHAEYLWWKDQWVLALTNRGHCPLTTKEQHHEIL